MVIQTSMVNSSIIFLINKIENYKCIVLGIEENSP